MTIEGETRYWDKTAVTGRGLEDYLHSMHLARQELIGRTVLDVGAGAANLARDVQAEHLDTNIVSLDPDFALDEDARARRRSTTIGWRGKIEQDPANCVAGVAEKTPFADASFDLILAHSSVPEYFPVGNMDDYQNRFFTMLGEFDRILKKGGEIRIFPMSIHIESQDDPYKELPYEKAALGDFLAVHSYTMESIVLENQGVDEWRSVLVLQK